MLRDVNSGSESWLFTHPGSSVQNGTEARIRNTAFWSTTLQKKNDFKVGLNHSTPTQSPPPLYV